MEKHTKILIGALTIFIFLAVEAVMRNVKAYMLDSAFSILISVLIYSTRKHWHVSHNSFALIEFSLILHNLGVFGFYNISPISIQWDRITHFMGILAATTGFFQFLEPHMKLIWTHQNFHLLAAVFFAALGVGAMIENVEYLGYLTLGFGEGGFMMGFGDVDFDTPPEGHTTDVPPRTMNETELIRNLGGGWHNTELDLVTNLSAAAITTIVLSLRKWKFGKHNTY